MEATAPSFATFTQIMRWRAQRHGDRRALTLLREGEEEAAVWSYRELDERGRAIAAVLMQRGATGRTVMLLYPTSLDFAPHFSGAFMPAQSQCPLPHRA